ncbi:MAG: choline dehydrogenase-like flavoprotein [Paraglaciecola sp.]|jgi:choline dehydrogenase-like flavoprotein
MFVLPDTSLEKNGHSQREYDVCIIGAGPAGIICALELENANPALKICLLESGGLIGSALNQELNAGENRSKILSDAEDPSMSRARGLGGTTSIWGGYLSTLDEGTFKEKDWIPNSGWPITLADLQPFYDKVAKYFLIPPGFKLSQWADENFYSVKFKGKALTEKLWKKMPLHFGAMQKSALEESKQIDLYLGTTCILLETDKSGAIIAAVCERSPAPCRFTASVHVVAMGGLENARFLLNQTKRNKILMPDTRRNVGRYFSTHPIFFFGALMLKGKILESKLYTGEKKQGATHIGYLKVPDDVRADNRWNDAYFEFGWPVPKKTSNAWQPIQHLTKGEHQGYNILAILNEMTALPENHVGLTDTLDRYGQNQLYIDMSLDRQTLDSSYAQYQYFAEALGANGFGRVFIKEKTVKDIMDGQGKEKFWGGHHHLCTTRMTASSIDGVVDKNCRVHDCENLYIAGSSTFSTGGIANPTFTIGALASRLAGHINSLLS